MARADKMLLSLVAAMVCMSGHMVASKTSCLDENGKPVDMFIIYKLPRYAAFPGNHYTYLDSHNMQFRTGSGSINTTSNAAALTLQQVYKQQEGEKLAHVFYNDAPPNETGYNFTFGHTKGQLAFDQQSGFWIIQSVPRFPTRVAKGYGYPGTGFKYGQMMMCVSYTASMFKEIGHQLKYTHPQIYDSNLPEAWEGDFKHMHDLISGSFIRGSLSRNTVLKSLGGVEYEHFGKTGDWHHDLYHDLVAPTLQTNLIVETWQHGKGNLGPSCKGDYTVVDMSRVGIKTSSKNYSFKTYDDHSKYAISTNEQRPIVCVGDINRQYSQFKRGGGCVCVKNLQLWKTFKKLVLKADSC